MLEGITRMTVLEIGRRQGLTVEERALPADELRGAEEVFITSTAGGVMPVAKIDGQALGDGRPGPRTLAIRQAYWDLHEDLAYSLAVDYQDERVTA